MPSYHNYTLAQINSTLSQINSGYQLSVQGKRSVQTYTYEPPWYSFVMPWEEPKLFRGRSKWRRCHERIAILESSLGITSPRDTFDRVLPWYKCLGMF